MTELYRLIAATAAERLGLAPRFTPLDSTSFHVDGRSNSDDDPAEHVVHITQGYRRDHRPDLNQVRLELSVEHHAGIPVLMQPLSGNSRDAQEFGHVITAHLEQLPTTYGATDLVADSALYSEAILAKLAQTAMPWITRVPATLRAAHAGLAHADPPAMTPLQAGYRSQEGRATDGGVEQRWVLIYSEPRQAQRTVDKQLRTQRDKASHAWKKWCGTPCACAAEARQALAAFVQNLPATFLATSTVRARPRYGKRGRPGAGMPPDQVAYQIDGALAASRAARQARVDQHRCVILATNALDDTRLPPPELLQGSKGQGQAERGFRFLKAPQFLASSLSLKKPERIMALLMVMTVCLLVYAALEYRIRHTLKAHAATCPDQKGKPTQHPTARWVCHYFVGMHLLSVSGQ